MTADLKELYQEIILDHNKRPRNRGALSGADRHAEGVNPLCGDRLTVYVKLKGDVIEDVSFVGGGCAISTAAASMMTEAVKGKTIPEARALFDRFHHVVAEMPTDGDARNALGKLAVFTGVRQYPVRVKCATLCWHTLKAALDNCDDVVSTE